MDLGKYNILLASSSIVRAISLESTAAVFFQVCKVKATITWFSLVMVDLLRYAMVSNKLSLCYWLEVLRLYAAVICNC